MKTKIHEAILMWEKTKPNTPFTRNGIYLDVKRKYPNVVENTFNTQWQAYMSVNRSVHNIAPCCQIAKLNIPTPCPKEVERLICDWNHSKKMEHYRKQEEFIRAYFEKNPLNDDLDIVIVKVCILNNFYSTNLNTPIRVAERIRRIEFDKKINVPQGETSLIAAITAEGKRDGDIEVDEEKYGNHRNCYSFATKYCHHHKSESFYIYDSNIAKILLHFRKDFLEEKLSKKNMEAKMKNDYSFFATCMDKFKKHFNISDDNWRLDKYLWQLGKKHFPTSKKKKNLAEN